MTHGDGPKILFTGPTGAGKSTAIRTLSAIAPPAALGGDNDVAEPHARAFAYGEFRPDGGAPLRLYGAPEQMRFDFMWKVLADEAMGLMVLLDHQRPAPASDALRYVLSFEALARRSACVVGVGRFDAARAPSLRAISDRLETAGFRIPVIEVDARRHDDMLRMMRTLVALARRHGFTPPDAQPTAPAVPLPE